MTAQEKTNEVKRVHRENTKSENLKGVERLWSSELSADNRKFIRLGNTIVAVADILYVRVKTRDAVVCLRVPDVNNVGAPPFVTVDFRLPDNQSVDGFLSGVSAMMDASSIADEPSSVICPHCHSSDTVRETGYSVAIHNHELPRWVCRDCRRHFGDCQPG